MGYVTAGTIGRKMQTTITTNRLKYMFLLTTFCSISFYFLLVYKTNYEFYNSLSIWSRIRSEVKINSCIIPILYPLDKSIEKFVQYPEVPRCLDPQRLILGHNQTHIWIKRKYLNASQSFQCRYQSFRRHVFTDTTKNFDYFVEIDVPSTRNFTDTIDVRHEFIDVYCDIVNSTIRQFFYFTPKKKLSRDNGGKITKNTSLTYNVLVLGIDSVSRLNFYRTMPKTIEYLKRKGAVDLCGFNKVGDNTFPNLIPILLGMSVQEIKTTCLPNNRTKFDDCPFLWKLYKQAGYYTAYGEDSVWLGTFNYRRPGFNNTPTDYYLQTFIRMAEFYVRNVKHSDFNSTPFCVNEQYFYKILLDYVQSLTVSLKSEKLFGFFWEITMSHDSLNYPMIMDKDYVNFFENLESSSYLNNSIILLLSDHGMRWGGIRYTKQGRLEERLPFVFVLMPQHFQDNYNEAFKNLQFNSGRLTTPYDIHATLFDLVNLGNLNNDIIISRSKHPSNT